MNHLAWPHAVVLRIDKHEVTDFGRPPAPFGFLVFVEVPHQHRAPVDLLWQSSTTTVPAGWVSAFQSHVAKENVLEGPASGSASPSASITSSSLTVSAAATILEAPQQRSSMLFMTQ